jgi:TPR repeat protein
MYLSGHGVPQDSVEGMRLNHLAAKQGDNSAIIWFLGQEYAEGEHVAQDYQEAFRWMKLYSAHSKTRRFCSDMMRKLSVT